MKKHPANLEACGLTESDARIFVPAPMLKGAVPDDEPDENDEEGTPEWKQLCIDLYVACQEHRWKGSCNDCLRYCEGQRGKWPYEKCNRQER
ncbi:hypothetical protein JY651_44560 [Pyxidicoccus parkwayensis]|uniref:Uncharacterized protein n=1 Tax=Pyxidicoccus parkwayensis TaxID=2813578 RepID=A0ABX7PDQ0_9BACT|nr:hypothetical protein JY651_44560 [Pyxidicoccus parkwaysis]